MDKNKRKFIILNTIIAEHIKTGAPVGSSVLADKYKLNISPATIRNEMSELENEGLIVQPYTSAGRVPTEKAYSLHIAGLEGAKIKESEKKSIEEILSEKNELNFKIAAKELAKFSNNAVFWAFHKNNLFYTGISNLLQQPEFAQTNLIYDISAIIDRLDEIMDEIFDEINYGAQISIGSANPFSKFCAAIMAKYKFGDNVGVFGILGPIRMDYGRNLSLIKYVYNKI